MKMLIEIPEYAFERIKEYYDALPEDSTVDAEVCYIANGIPLPKGHGRLIDADVLRKEVSSWGMNDYEPSDFTDEIDRAQTIIEADNS